MNRLLKNDYIFHIDTRTLEDFNGECYKYIDDLSENLMSNEDFVDTIESFLESLSSMHATYDVKMSKFVLNEFLTKAREFKYGYHQN